MNVKKSGFSRMAKTTFKKHYGWSSGIIMDGNIHKLWQLIDAKDVEGLSFICDGIYEGHRRIFEQATGVKLGRSRKSAANAISQWAVDKSTA